MVQLKRIIVHGRLNANLKSHLAGQSGREFIFATDDTLTQALLDTADAFVGFRLVPGFSYEHLKWIHCLGAGVDNVVQWLDPSTQTIVTRTTGPFGQKIAEYSLSYILRDVQCHDVFASEQRRQRWNPVAPGILAKQRILVFGTGDIGKRVAEVLAFFGATIVGVSRSGGQDARFSQVFSIQEIMGPIGADILAGVGYIINTLPLTKETEKIFDDALFCRCEGAMFINVGRGGSVDMDALVRALNASCIRHAVLDVFDEEPLSQTSPIWRHENILVTPHISAVTTAEEAAACLVETARLLESGAHPVSNRVDLRKGY
ncbi:hypothetical protein N007_07325 [Alicyclobacillus acidoterrestris ATCC 49025]|nr:hypothetical protein N007_07325 [Alicyclobacillus acidoterrestris ATCC 49025]